MVILFVTVFFPFVFVVSLPSHICPGAFSETLLHAFTPFPKYTLLSTHSVCDF